MERITGPELLLQKNFCQINSYALLEHLLQANALSVYKVKDEGRQSQLSFMLYYYISLMRNMFQLKYNKPPSEGIWVPNKSHHVNYIDSHLMLVYIVEISTLQSSEDKISRNY
jgi:hypothetical protein